MNEAQTLNYAEYAQRSGSHEFLISGSAGRGNLATIFERRQLLDLWMSQVEVSRLIACCWTHEDLEIAAEKGIRAMAVLQNLKGTNECLNYLGTLPAGCLIYSHPRYSDTTLTPEVAKMASRRDCLPSGAKVSKTSFDDLSALHSIVGPAFDLLHGSSRNIARSAQCGATGVVAAALSHLPPLPNGVAGLQRVIDDMQCLLDNLPSPDIRIDLLIEKARNAIETVD